MQLPQSIVKAAQAAADANPTDVNAATDAALAAIQSLPEFADLAGLLVREAVQGEVYAARHRTNVQIKREQGLYGQPPKVVVGRSADIDRIYESVYNIRIGGTVLGELTGDAIPRLRAGELASAAGHQLNAALLMWLENKGVRGDKRVRDVVSERQLKKALQELAQQLRGDQAAG